MERRLLAVTGVGAAVDSEMCASTDTSCGQTENFDATTTAAASTTAAGTTKASATTKAGATTTTKAGATTTAKKGLDAVSGAVSRASIAVGLLMVLMNMFA